jgi:hypothetical protein
VLLIEAKIIFYMPTPTKYGYSHELDAKAIIRRPINLGGSLWTGQIFPPEDETILYRGQTYNAMIEIPFVFGDAYDEVKTALGQGKVFLIQDGSRAVGEGEILNFAYENDEDRWRK